MRTTSPALLSATVLLVALLSACTASPGATASSAPTTPAASTGTSPEPSPVSPSATAPAATEPAPEPAAPAPTEPAAGTLAVELTYAVPPSGSTPAEASGLVTGVIEDGGTCTFTFSSAGRDVRVVTAGAADASSTTCGRAEFPASRLAPGTWQVTLTYVGPGGTGTSPATEVVVP